MRRRQPWPPSPRPGPPPNQGPAGPCATSGTTGSRTSTAPEHLFHLVAAGLAEDFPPPRSLPTPSNLPAVPTTFVGRDAELAEASELLARPGCGC